MSISAYLVNKKNQDFLIIITKIIIIGYVSYSLISSAIPFYLGYDDVNYGIATINLSQGNYEITNDLFIETGDTDFFPNSYVKTIHNSIIPKSNPGIYVLGEIFYFIGGFFGLFYFGPIVTILLLILFERIVTKFFGNLVGLLALLLLVADWEFYYTGLRFLTDNIFSLFFILGIFSIIKFLNNKDDKYIFYSSTFFSISTFFRISGIVFFPAEILIFSSFFIIPYLKDYKIFHKNNLEIIFIKQIFFKFNFRKFLKRSLFLILPWLIFLTFWFSYNYYYFGDINTNYRDQLQTNRIDEEQIIPAIPLSIDELSNQLRRVQLLQYYLVPLVPDPLYFFLIIISNTDLDIWRSDIWIAVVTFSLLLISLIMSLYFKIKRKEILTIFIFIVALVLFYSSPLASSDPLATKLSEHANNRYMIPASMLSFILIGYILVVTWSRCFLKYQTKYQKIVKTIKTVYGLLVVVFFLALTISMPSIQDFYQTGFHFNNPEQYSKSYDELEKLPEKSFIVGHSGRETLLHTDTHFYPYDINFTESQGNPQSISLTKIDTLKKILEEGYTGYAFKNNMFLYDEKYFKFLEAEHGILLKDYSDTFCKLELLSKNNFDYTKVKSDPICFEDVTDRGKKIWNVTLKWPY